MAGRFRHRVTAECFYQDVWRSPDKHSMVVTAKPFTKNEKEIAKDQDKREYEPLPSYLEPLDYEFDDAGNPVFDGEVAEASGGADINATDEALTLAAEFGIDIETVEGSGKDGKVTKGDVKKIVDDLNKE